MRKIVLIDSNALFRSDIQGRLMIGGYDDLDITAAGENDDAEELIKQTEADEVLISVKTAQMLPSLSFGVPSALYARNKEEQKQAENLSNPSLGIVSSASDLLETISRVTVSTLQQRCSERQEEDAGTGEAAVLKDSEILEDYDKKSQQRKPGREARTTEDASPLLDGPSGFVSRQGDTDNHSEETMIRWSEESRKTDQEIRSELKETENSGLKKRDHPEISGISLRERVLQRKKEEERRFLNEKQKPSEEAEALFKRDAGYTKERAKVIAVTSAKGGVGKTTIACELATYLACTSSGKENFKVCLVDGNIAFGGVLSTLDFSAELANMSHWTADIRKQLIGCRDPLLIRYTEKQIAFYLQQQRDSGLFTLLAPITHDDSMFIEPVHFSVMLNNLIENGGFDYIICDTGSNADDYTVTALEAADTVLLVLTQNVNTASCNRAFLETLSGIGFDMEVFRIVLNQVKTGRAVALEAQELALHVTNPVNGEKFQCLSQIKDSDEVRTCGNLGEPAVFKSGSDFTRSIGEIAAALIGHEYSLDVPEKKGWFSRTFGRK